MLTSVMFVVPEVTDISFHWLAQVVLDQAILQSSIGLISGSENELLRRFLRSS